MNTLRTGIISVILILPGLLFAGRQEGVMAEFSSVEGTLKSKRVGPEKLQHTLERNLIRALGQAIDRRYYLERGELKKDLKPENIAYENPTSETIYYVKYKNFLARFDFSRNPELFEQGPIYVRFLVVEGSAPAPSAPAQPGSPGTGTR
jgi:hypothetical protein